MEWRQIKINKKNNKNFFNDIWKKLLKINNEIEKETNWENIQSFYSFDVTIYICPSVKNYLNKYYNGNFIPLKPNDEILND